MAVVYVKKAVKFISIGNGSAVSANRIISIVTPEPAARGCSSMLLAGKKPSPFLSWTVTMW
jgi:hypothetical protein